MIEKLASAEIFIRRSRLVTFSIFLVFFIFNILKVKEFVLWSQIEEDYVISSLASFQAHSIRIILVNGLIEFIQFFSDVDRIRAFNVAVGFILLLSTLMFSKQIYGNLTKNLLLAFLLSTIPMAISFFQNGRGVLGCFAILLLYTSCVTRYHILRWFFLIIAAIFANVSSGIFSVFAITIIIGVWNRSFVFIKKKYLFFILLPVVPLFILYLDKNLAFYDYSFFNLLSHGLGSIFHYDILFVLPILFLLLLLFFFLIYYLIFFKPRALWSIEFPFISASIVGLFFGFSSFNCFVYLHILFLLYKIRMWLSPQN